MKKALILLLTAMMILGMLSGCSKAADKKKNTEAAKSAFSEKAGNSSNGAAAKKQLQDEIKNIGDPKKMDDSQFISDTMKGETEVKLDNIDQSIEELGDLDALINDKDPMANIESNVKLDK